MDDSVEFRKGSKMILRLAQSYVYLPALLCTKLEKERYVEWVSCNKNSSGKRGAAEVRIPCEYTESETRESRHY